MADGNAVAPIKKTKRGGPRKQKSLAREAEFFAKRLATLQRRLEDTRAKIPPKVVKMMKLIEELEKA